MPQVTPSPQQGRSVARASAFTLIELLTVIAIIGILAAILIPVTAKVRQSARAAHCTKNLHSMGSAFQLYSADNRGLYPALRFRTDSNPISQKNPSGENWQIELSPYQSREVKALAKLNATSDSYVFCPQFISSYQDDPKWKSTISTSAGYGMNPNLRTGTNTWDLRFRASAIPNPSRSILVGDSGSYHLNIIGDWKTDSSQLGGYTSGDPVRHGSKAGYLFSDGHVSSLSPEDALVVLTAP